MLFLNTFIPNFDIIRKSNVSTQFEVTSCNILVSIQTDFLSDKWLNGLFIVAFWGLIAGLDLLDHDFADKLLWLRQHLTA